VVEDKVNAVAVVVAEVAVVVTVAASNIMWM